MVLGRLLLPQHDWGGQVGAGGWAQLKPGNSFTRLESLLLWMSKSISSVQSLSHVQRFATPWTTTRQASLSITNSQNLLKLMSIESVMPSNHLILCHPFFLLPSIFPRPESFQMSQFFTSGGQSIGVSASASVLPVNIQDWFPLGWTGWISLLKTYKLEEKLYSMEILGSPREVLFLMFKEGEVYNLRPGAV